MLAVRNPFTFDVTFFEDGREAEASALANEFGVVPMPYRQRVVRASRCRHGEDFGFCDRGACDE